ncbi:MAG TPA: pantoate--beta-alanine ligase [Gemmatimonadales bacterium]|nr:pantoate--beta-alanine ligase [Gemmatimonadales bacterium]
MLQISDPHALRSWVRRERQAGRRIALVPTMGALHEGHLSLVDLARRRADAVVLSVFVNPLQFGPGEDYARYPRDLARDAELAARRGVEVLFAPAVEQMYPAGSEIRVVAGETASDWEGAVRPGHFTGVLTVVAKLFNLVQPDVAVFGQKDIQQATLIRKLVRDLDFPIEVAIGGTVREPDGLAMSSRNAYLSAAERRDALALVRALRAAETAWKAGERDAARLERILRDEFRMHPAVALDYIAIVDPADFRPVARAEPGTIIAVAGRVGTTRLLDNVILGAEP